MTRLNSLLAAAALPFRTRKRAPAIRKAKPILRDGDESNPRVHEDWLFEDERPTVGKPDVLSRLGASLCRLRNCLVDVAEEAPLVEERPARYRVEFSEYSTLADEALFDDELFDEPPRPEPVTPAFTVDTLLFERSPGLMHA